MFSFKLYLFGSPRLEQDGKPVEINRRKALALLAYLALNPKSHSRDALAALFWPDYGQSQARTNLRRALADLNAVLGKGFLAAEGDQVSLINQPRLWVDVIKFQSHLESFRIHQHSSGSLCNDCFLAYNEAARLYSADLMTGFSLPDAPAFDEWLYFESESLRSRYAQVLENLVHYQMQSGRFAEAISLARRWAAMDPLLEPAQIALMQLYVRNGQRAAAIRQYQQYAGLLQSELRVTPGNEITGFYQSIQTDRETPIIWEPPLLPSNPPGNLPPQNTPFIGRDEEIGEVTRLLSSPFCRLLTLTGLGGVGKTRLAMEAAGVLNECFPDGCYFAPVESVVDQDALIQAVAGALHLPSVLIENRRAQIFNSLSGKNLLLILDNFEHLLKHASFLSDLLLAAPGLKILVTSREPLNLQEETILRLEGLDFPCLDAPPSELEPSLLSGYSALQLFVSGAQRVLPSFSPVDSDWLAIARICCALEGIPLCILLAAAWAETLSLEEIHAEITRNIDFLESGIQNIPERHRSIRVVFDGSWRLLGEVERDTFIRLSVFQNGFTRQAAQQVAGADLRVLRSLVAKSLLRSDLSSGRFSIHSLLRQYASELLAQSSFLETTDQSHAAYFAGFLSSRQAAIKGPGLLDIVAEINSEFDDIRAAWFWSCSNREYPLIDEMIECLYVYCVTQNLWTEAEVLFDRARSDLRPQPGEDPHPVWGRVLTYYYGEGSQPKLLVLQGLAIAELHGDPASTAHCQAELGWLAIKEMDFSGAIDWFEKSLAYYRQNQDDYFIIVISRSLAGCYQAVGQSQKALRYGQDSLELSRRSGSRLRVGECLGTCGILSVLSGEYSQAARDLQQACSIQREVGNVTDMLLNNLVLGWLDLLNSNFEGCRLLANEVLTITSGANTQEFRGIALLELALISALTGDLPTAHNLFHAARSVLASPLLKPWASAINPVISFFTDWGTAVTAFSIGEPGLCRQMLNETLSRGHLSSNPTLRGWWLPVAAALLERQNERIQALKALSMSIPAHSGTWFESWEPLRSLISEIPPQSINDPDQAIDQIFKSL